MKKLVIIPTYDERENVRRVAEVIFGSAPQSDVLFVDDNSPDGTGDILEAMHASEPRVHVLHRPGKMGLGRAYISGFKWGLERDYELLFEMDADLSHDPAEIPNFARAAREADLVLGSRYLNGIRVTNWPLHRLLLSVGAARYVRLITGLPVTDPTGGYKCYRRRVLEAIDLDSVVSNGYSFQVEMTYVAWMKGFHITEIPIIFTDRHQGYSKMSAGIAQEALWLVWKLALRHGFRRRPRRAATESAGQESNA